MHHIFLGYIISKWFQKASKMFESVHELSKKHTNQNKHFKKMQYLLTNKLWNFWSKQFLTKWWYESRCSFVSSFGSQSPNQLINSNKEISAELFSFSLPNVRSIKISSNHVDFWKVQSLAHLLKEKHAVGANVSQSQNVARKILFRRRFWKCFPRVRTTARTISALRLGILQSWKK